jgi:molecular chaperone DnaK
VPAYFNDNQRQATKDAGRIAGLEILRILNEPTAAALAYGFGRGLEQRVAVYDLGGGTFDISVLEIGKDIFEVLSTCGDTFLGGDDFDDRLIDLLADEFVAKEGINPRNDPYAFEKLKVAAETAKKGLSADDEVQIHIPDVLTGEDGVVRSLERSLTRSEFGKLVQDLTLRTFKVCDEALQQAELTVRDLDGVILVGGPTRLPLVREAVAQYFQQEAHADVDPDEVVAMGAAIHADSLVSGSHDSFLLDVTPLDLRIGVAGGLAEPVIERNTPVPIEQTRHFTTLNDFQESVQIRVYQGEAIRAEDNELLGHFDFSGFEKAKRGDAAIDVTFEINTDGIVNVTACDPHTGERASTSITLSSGLSEEELQQIVQEDRAGRVAPATTPLVAAPADLPLDDAGPEAIGSDDDTSMELIADSEIADVDLDGISLEEVELESVELCEEDLAGAEVEFAEGDLAEAELELEAEDVAIEAGEIELETADVEPLAGLENADPEDSVQFAKIELQKIPAHQTAVLEPEAVLELEPEAVLEEDPDDLFDRGGKDLTEPD